MIMRFIVRADGAFLPAPATVSIRKPVEDSAWTLADGTQIAIKKGTIIALDQISMSRSIRYIHWNRLELVGSVR